MPTIRFGRTGAHIPTISLGTWGHGGPNTSEGAAVGWSGHDDSLALAALRAAWQAGETHWDTADAYGAGHAEELIGRAFSEVPREEIFVASKFGWVKGPAGHFYDPRFMREQCEASLRNMKTDHLDLHYFHHCDFGEGDRYLDGALETMHQLRAEGKVRFVGLSDWDASKILRFAPRIDPDVVQPFRNVIDDEYEASGLKAYVEANDCGVAFFSPLKHGLLLGKYDGPQRFAEGDFRSGVPQFADAGFVQRMRDARSAVEGRFIGSAEPVLRALTGVLLEGNPTATVLLGQRNPSQVAAAAKVGEALSAEDASWVRELYRQE